MEYLEGNRTSRRDNGSLEEGIRTQEPSGEENQDFENRSHFIASMEVKDASLKAIEGERVEPEAAVVEEVIRDGGHKRGARPIRRVKRDLPRGNAHQMPRERHKPCSR